MTAVLDPGLLDAFGAALESERHALLQRDAEALKAACAAKNDCLRLLARVDTANFVAGPHADRLRALADLNRANGELIARRRRDVEWTLTRLGRAVRTPDYDPSGLQSTRPGARPLATA